MNDQPGWFRRTFLRQKGLSISSPEALRLLGVPVMASGVRISVESALSVPAVRAAVHQIAGVASTLDCKFIRQGPGGQRTELDPAEYAPAAVLKRPNPWTTGVEFRRNLLSDYLLAGAGYAHVVRLRDKPAELHRIDPRAMSAQVDPETFEPIYRATINGQSLTLSWRDVLCIRNLTVDGLRGRGAVEDGAEAIGAAAMLESFVARLFAGGARPGGILKSKKRLNKEAAERLAAAWKAVVGGDTTGGVAVLEDELDYQTLGLSNKDADTLALREFQVVEIARVMNVNPILLQDMGKATFNNATAVQQLHLSHTLMPILELLEDEIERVLLPKEDRDTVCAEFDTRGFVRADVEKAAAALRTEVELGVATINEARADRGRSPVAGGDAPRTTIQTQPIGASSTPPKGR